MKRLFLNLSPNRHALLIALLGVIGILAQNAGAATLPENFVDEQVATGFQRPVDLAIDPTGRLFVAEKQGIVWIVNNGVKQSPPFINLVAEVHNASDKGMLGLALDPNFAQNGYVYLLYQVDPTYGQPDENVDVMTFGRLTRYTIGANNTAIASSRKILLGNSFADGIPHGSRSHGMGALRFAPDGMLYLSAGDGAHFDFADGGQDATAYDPDFAAIWGPAEDIGALRSQRIDSLDGKVLRINPQTGEGLPDNPFFETGAPNSNRSKVWAYGLRNPFRFAIRPNSGLQGRLYIGDVGWSAWEELNVSKQGGENFGWPCYEGDFQQPSYKTNALTAPTCLGISSSQVTPPLIPWHHTQPGALGFTGNCSAGVTFYEGTSFPFEYWGDCFIADYGKNWIKAVKVDENDNLVSITDFASGLNSPVDLEYEPSTGGILYVQAFTNEIRRIRYSLSNLPPIVTVSATPPAGRVPLNVQFSTNGTFDPNSDPLTYAWDFDDGTTSNLPNPVHAYTVGGSYTVTLTVADNHQNETVKTLLIESLNEPPSVHITAPADNYIFDPGESVQFAAAASDVEDGENLTYFWEAVLVHNNHLHPDVFLSDEKNPPPFDLSSHGALSDRYSYVVTVTVTDGGGLSATDSIRLIPSDLGGNQIPTARMLVAPRMGAAPMLVGFDAEPSSDPDGDHMTYTWDFGDGTSGEGLSTTHVYEAPGSYVATLTATDVTGAQDTSSVPIVTYGPSPRADYYNNTDFTDFALARDEEPIDFNWGEGAPDPLVGADTFSVRWTGVVVPQFSETYTFSTITDDGIRLWVNGQLLIDQWIEQGPTEYSGTLDLAAGVPVAIKVEYYEQLYGAQIRLAWSSASQPEEVIPAARLFAPLPPNQPPIVDAGHDLRVKAGTPISIEGAAADDGIPGQAPVGFEWSAQAGPGPVALADPSVPVVSATFPSPGNYVLRLTAGDGELTAFDETSILVNTPPVATGAAAITNEDSPLPILLTGDDLNADPLGFTLESLPAHGILTGTPPYVIYTPLPNYFGPDSFTFTAHDDLDQSSPATVTIQVAGVNDPPIALPQTLATPEDTAVAIALTGTDVDGDTLTFQIIDPPANGMLTGAPPNLTYTPNPDWNGTDTFLFKTGDPFTASPAARVDVQVTPVNDSPVAFGQNLNAVEDTALTVHLTGSDVDGDALTVLIVTPPGHGALSGTLPNVTYHPGLNWNGSDTFTFAVSDGSAASAPASIAISVLPANDAPIANPQSVHGDEDTAIPLTLSGSDLDADTLAFSIVRPPTRGTLSGTPPNLTYTPNPDQNGHDEFTFQASDGTLQSAPAQVDIEIHPVNDPSVAHATTVQAVEDTMIPITLTASDLENDSLSFSILSPPAHGTLSGTPPTLQYTPHTNVTGADSFTFHCNDGNLDSDEATITIEIAPINDPPVASPQSVNATEDSPVNVALAGSDVEQSPLAFAIVGAPSHGTLTGLPPDVTYSPNPDFNGDDTFTFKANDGEWDSEPATVMIHVSPANDLPVASPIQATGSEDSAIPVTLTGSDVDGQSLSFAIVTQPAHGTLGGTPPHLTYTPATNFNGADNFTFKANDGEGDSPVAVADITVLPANDPPQVAPTTLVVDEGASKLLSFSGADVDADPLTFEIVAPPKHGTLAPLGHDFSYTPALDYNGLDALTYRAWDGTAFSAPASIAITINPLPRLVLMPGSAVMEGDRTISVRVRLAGPASIVPVSVTLDVAGGSATRGEDYLFDPTVLNFDPGVTSVEASITILDDQVKEGPESIILALSNASHARLAAEAAVAQIDILDDDSISASRGWEDYE